MARLLLSVRTDDCLLLLLRSLHLDLTSDAKYSIALRPSEQQLALSTQTLIAEASFTKLPSPLPTD